MTNYNQNTGKKKSLVEMLAGNRESLKDRIIEKPGNINEFLPTASTAPEGFEGSSKAVYTHTDSQSAVTDSMNKNSTLWWEAKAAGDTDWMKSLEAANKQLASLLGDGVTFDSAAGTWSGVADVPATMQGSMATGVNPVLPSYNYDEWLASNPTPTFNYDEWLASNPTPTYDYNEWLANNPTPTFESAYRTQIDDLMNQLLNREQFSYNAETDPLFQQYQKQYTREGTRSMNDTLAAAASGAGGMNSAAITAAQQANNYHMAQLGDRFPELQQLAYDMYVNDLTLQRHDINMLAEMDNSDYNRYRNSMSDWNANRNFGYGMYRDSMSDWNNNRDFDYGMYRDSMYDWNNDRNFGYGMYRDSMGDYQWGTELNYGAYRDQVADDRYKTEWEHALEREAIEDEWRNKEWDYGVSRDQVEDAWRDKEWNYGVGRDQISDSRYNSGDAYDRAMDLLMNGVMPNADLLAQAGISEADATGLLSQNSSGYEEPDDPNSEDKFWNSVNALGIGPVNAITIEEIANYGGITENADGTVKWANGWNASNYKEKLKQAKSFSFGMFLP